MAITTNIGNFTHSVGNVAHYVGSSVADGIVNLKQLSLDKSQIALETGAVLSVAFSVFAIKQAYNQGAEGNITKAALWTVGAGSAGIVFMQLWWRSFWQAF
jgi:hypothetical protein